MPLDHIAAVVVTFHPDADVIDNLAAVRPQVLHLVVVDNGSSPAEVTSLRRAAELLRFDLVENNDNLGIATALNQGIRHLQRFDVAWILLFDQDSRVTPGLVDAMLHRFTSSAHAARLGILVPRYMDMRHGYAIAADRIPDGTLDVVMTSGSLLRAETFTRHGLFLDELFIDCVDSEYSLRLRRAGLILDECSDAILLHSPGTPVEHSFLGGKPFQATNYSPIRRYYQARNRVWMLRRYLFAFPHYCLRLTLTSLKDLLKIVLVESDKRRKAFFWFRGLRDGVLGRMGKLQSP